MRGAVAGTSSRDIADGLLNARGPPAVSAEPYPPCRLLQHSLCCEACNHVISESDVQDSVLWALAHVPSLQEWNTCRMWFALQTGDLSAARRAVSGAVSKRYQQTMASESIECEGINFLASIKRMSLEGRRSWVQGLHCTRVQALGDNRCIGCNYGT